MIRLTEIKIDKWTRNLMQKALREGWIGQGPYIEQFETELKKFLGVKYAIATASGTAAISIALATIKEFAPQKTKVIVPALTFISQIHACYYNHLTPVFVDCKKDLQINEEIEKLISEDTLAIFVTHLLGAPCEMNKIISLARKYHIWVIEDACEAFGSEYYGQKLGTIGDMGCFSFFPSHTLATGEGGAVVTNCELLARLAVSLRNFGTRSSRPEDRFIFDRIGFNGKMNSLEAIIGLGHLRKIKHLLGKRHNNFLYYKKFLLSPLKEETYMKVIPHGFPVTAINYEERERLLRIFETKYNIECRRLFCSIPTQSKAYSFLNIPKGSFPNAEFFGETGIYFPVHQYLSEKELNFIIGAIKKEMPYCKI